MFIHTPYTHTHTHMNAYVYSARRQHWPWGSYPTTSLAPGRTRPVAACLMFVARFITCMRQEDAAVSFLFFVFLFFNMPATGGCSGHILKSFR